MTDRFAVRAEKENIKITKTVESLDIQYLVHTAVPLHNIVQ